MTENSILGTGLSFGQFIITVIVLILGAVTLKITFDLNKYQSFRREKYRAKCINACLHFEFITDKDGGVIVSPLFFSPAGTLSYICQRCSLVRHHVDEQAIYRNAEYYIKNPKEYVKQNKKFYKYLRKSGNL